MFALFAHATGLWFGFGVCGLVVASLAMARAVRETPAPARLLGLVAPQRSRAFWISSALVLGCGLAALNRALADLGAPLPTTLTLVAALAAVIGATEELFFRGYIQGRLQSVGAAGAVLIAAGAHAIYKYALFIAPPHGIDSKGIKLGLLGLLTFVVGCGLACMRHWSRSVLPSIAAHACFDIINYGDLAEPPWWVWY